MHQTGEADLESTRELYRKFTLQAEVGAFWADMPALLAASSLAICRAGGTTLAELSAVGAPGLAPALPARGRRSSAKERRRLRCQPAPRKYSTNAK